MASGLRMNSRRLREHFDRQCESAHLLVDSAGSRTVLSKLLSDIEATLTELCEEHDKLISAEETDQEVAETLIKHAKDQYQAVYDRAKQYLIDRQDDARSCASLLGGSIASSRASAEAASALELRRLQAAQTRQRSQLALQQKQIELQIEQQRSDDAVATAELELKIAQQMEDPLFCESTRKLGPDTSDHQQHVEEERGPADEASKLPQLHDACNAYATFDGRVNQSGYVDIAPSANAVPSAKPVASAADLQTRHKLNPTAPVFQPIASNIATAPVYPSYFLPTNLPRLTLPQFNGQPAEWPRWSALFHSLVHDQPAITNREKMLHLQSAVTGAAKHIVAGFMYDGDMYPEAIRALEDRYGNEDDVVRVVLKDVFLFPITSNSDSAVLEKFHAKIHSAVTIMQQRGFSSDLKSSENTRRVAEKLPTPLKRNWAEYVSSMSRNRLKPDMITIDNWLAERVKTSLYLDSISHKVQHPPTNDRLQPRRTDHQIAQRVSLNVVPSSKPPVRCPHCDGMHKLHECSVFMAKSLDEKAEIVAKGNICFYCLRKGHGVNTCRTAKKCGIDGCRMRHHVCLHGSTRVTIAARPTSEVTDAKTIQPTERTAAAVAMHNNTVLLQVVPVDVLGVNGRKVRVNALLDPGAQTSLCEVSVLEELGLRGETQMLTLRNAEGSGPAQVSQRLSIDLQPVQATDQEKIHVPEVFTVRQLNVAAPKFDFRKHLHKWVHLEDIDLPHLIGDKIRLLLGANVLEAVVQIDIRKGRQNQPIGVKTAFGWTLTGQVSGLNIHHGKNVMHVAVEDESSHLTEQLKTWWSTESFGCKYQGELVRSKEDQRALRILEETSVQKGEHYEVGLLWKEDVKFPDNYTMASRRLNSLERRLMKNPDLAEAYEQQVQALLDNNFARKLNSVELKETQKRGWLLPHHPVVNPRKGNKVRLVFDAAAKYQDTSLNDKLLTGPDLLQNLAAVLLRFRENRYAIAGDIQQMFYQIRVMNDDQPALRFLWRDFRKDATCDIYQMQVHIFGAKCSPSVANFILSRVARDHCDSTPTGKKTATAIQRNFYVDDFLRSEKTKDAAKKIMVSTIEALKRGGFRLHKWNSNDEEILKVVPSTERSVEPNVSTPTDAEQKTLGYTWNTCSDTLSVNYHPLNLEPTKRSVLKCVASVFDPLGFFSPFTIVAKIMLQEIWAAKRQWDDILEDNHRNRWLSWCQQAEHLGDVGVSRCFKVIDTGDEAALRDLHVFCDASELAFAAAIYSRVITADGVAVNLVMSRSRLAPLKRLSIVRLELQAAVMAVRLASAVQAALSYSADQVLYWSDSKVVLQYIRNESRRFNTFVGNRVAEIQELSHVHQWRHVPGNVNPADAASRGKELRELVELKLWWNGPSFLQWEKSKWPHQEVVEELQHDDPEVKQQQITPFVCTQLIDASFLPSPEKYPLLRYLRILAWILRYVHNLHKSCSSQRPLERRTGALSASEMSEALNLGIRVCQHQHFRSEIKLLKSSGTLPDSSKLSQLSPFLDKDDILRVDGRIREASVSLSVKHPVILPREAVLTRLIITRVHQENAHCGLEHTLNEVRCRYWIPKGRSLIKNVLLHCAFCAKRRALPHPPRMADIPADRFDSVRPFNVVGLDFLGPLEVKKHRKTEKRYLLLITCMSVRAVHLEVTHSLDTDSFLMALRRFFARRGKPSKIISDNGRNLVGGERELRESINEWNQTRIIDSLSQREITWKFNPPGAPHMGGVWERLVGTVKRALKVVLKSLRLTDEVLQTVVTEVEFIVNSRPLTYVSSDVRDIEPLTPNHFLLGSVEANLSPGLFTREDTIGRKRWRQSQALVDQLWKRWLKEYVPTLLARRKWTTEADNMKKDDVVLMVDENQARGHWPLARVVETYPGKDGRIRIVDVRTANGSTYKRPVTKLCRFA